MEDVQAVIEVEAPRERVWRALVEPAEVEAWLGCLRFAPRVGHVFYMQPRKDRREAEDVTDSIVCRITTLDAPRRLGFTWGFPENPDTWVDIQLTRIPGGTHVRLTHSGWDQFEPEEVEAIRAGLARGWADGALPALRRVVEASAA